MPQRKNNIKARANEIIKNNNTQINRAQEEKNDINTQRAQAPNRWEKTFKCIWIKQLEQQIETNTQSLCMAFGLLHRLIWIPRNKYICECLFFSQVALSSLSMRFRFWQFYVVAQSARATWFNVNSVSCLFSIPRYRKFTFFEVGMSA